MNVLLDMAKIVISVLLLVPTLTVKNMPMTRVVGRTL